MKGVYEITYDGKIWAGESLNLITSAINATIQDQADFINQASLYELVKGNRRSKFSKGARVQLIQDQDGYKLPDNAVWVPRTRKSSSTTAVNPCPRYAVCYSGVWYVSHYLIHIVQHINGGIEDPRDHLKVQSLCSLSTGKYSGKKHKNSICIRLEEGHVLPDGAVSIP